MFVGVPISALRTDCYKTPIGLKDWLVSFPYRILPVAIASVLTLSSCTDRQYDLLTGPEPLESDEQVPAKTGVCLMPNGGIPLESGVTELLICGVTVRIGPYVPGTVFGEFQSGPDAKASSIVIPPTFRPQANWLFDPPVSSATIIFFNYTSDEKYMIAFNAAGEAVDIVTFAGHVLGVTRTVSGLGIVRVSVGGPGAFGLTFLSFVRAGLELTCTPASVTRGEPTSCTASAMPAGATLQVQEWSFVGAGGLTANEVSNESTWSGPLVVSGTVTVRALVDETELTSDATVTVGARNWSAVHPSFEVVDASPGLRAEPRPTEIGQFGAVQFEVTADGAVAAVAEVPSGPNAGFHYLTAIPYGVRARVFVNTVALRVRSEFWYTQPRRRRTNAAGEDLCGRADVVPFIAVVREHEGMTFASGSHTRFYRDKLFELAGPPLENVVMGQLFAVLSAVNTPFADAMEAAGIESDKADDAQNAPMYCFFTGTRY